MVQKKHLNIVIIELKNNDGIDSKGERTLERICFGFYQDLYNDSPQAPRPEALANFLNLILKHFNKAMNLDKSH